MKTKVHLGQGWYVPVDEAGYCIGTCYEGALGVIIQLFSSLDDNWRFALKLPRLLADTPRENHHICRLMEDERRVVYDLFAGNLSTTGLLQAQVINQGLLENPVTNPNPTDADQRAQNGNVVLVSFEKGRRPRFVSLGLDGSGQFRYPKGLSEELKKELQTLIGPAEFQNLLKSSNDELEHGRVRSRFRRAYYVPCFVRRPELNPGFAPLSDAAQSDTQQTCWFAFLPCVVYRWASGTYQEALTTRNGLTWNLFQQVEFFEQILNAINSLHSRKFALNDAQTWGSKKGLLHGDLRPANVMHTGDSSRPQNFCVIDYGSLAEDPVAPGLLAADPEEATMAGPMVSPMRVSPFYAPERRAATERESADTAVIISVENADKQGREGGHLVCLGWRTSVLDADARPKAEMVDELIQRLNEWLTRGLSAAESDTENTEWPRRGDRVRIRDYIFLIHDFEISKDRTLLFCTNPYFEVFHDRLAAQVQGDPPSGQKKDGRIIWWLPISRVTELRQVKPAADIFSFGAICLYTLYHCRPPKSGYIQGKPDEQMERVLSNLETDAADEQLSEARFEEMLQTLASEQCFRHVWLTLEDVREKLERLAEQQVRAQRVDLQARDFSWSKQPDPGTDPPFKQQQSVDPPIRWVSVYDQVLHVAAFVTQSIPACRVILLKMGGNTAYFVLFMHYIFCCLHRKSTLHKILNDTPEAERRSPQQQPFCLDRLGADENWKAVESALVRLGELNRVFQQKSFWCEFWAEAKDIPLYEPASEHALRVKVETLRASLNISEKKWDDVFGKNQVLWRQLEELRGVNQTFGARLEAIQQLASNSWLMVSRKKIDELLKNGSVKSDVASKL